MIASSFPDDVHVILRECRLCMSLKRCTRNLHPQAVDIQYLSQETEKWTKQIWNSQHEINPCSPETFTQSAHTHKKKKNMRTVIHIPSPIRREKRKWNKLGKMTLRKKKKKKTEGGWELRLGPEEVTWKIGIKKKKKIWAPSWVWTRYAYNYITIVKSATTSSPLFLNILWYHQRFTFTLLSTWPYSRMQVIVS